MPNTNPVHTPTRMAITNNQARAQESLSNPATVSADPNLFAEINRLKVENEELTTEISYMEAMAEADVQRFECLKANTTAEIKRLKKLLQARGIPIPEHIWNEDLISGAFS